jgi:hypothetical protein
MTNSRPPLRRSIETTPAVSVTLDDTPLIEVMARAIRDVAGNRSSRGQPWAELPSTLRESYRAEARAALQAAREFAAAKGIRL